ncbi:TcaA NTF2-like domain-containing protein [Staphylococcus aureus]|uniref:TcaA NTF2-like domain-containing protein n=1 Tax=Staphylococcus aureus TaxID=1280 RepID=UPI0018EA42BB|nr:hypothetical protein [Staphylococcus aureus]MBJ6239734.1 hypothetical protein [Staphylococcus aureus]
MEHKNTKHKYIIYGSIAITLVLIIGIVTYLISVNNAKGQIKKFEKSVQENKYNTIANQLSNSENTITKSDAKNFVKYVKEEEHKSSYNKQIKAIKKKIDSNNNNNTDYGSINDEYGNKIISIRKNGKKFFFIDKLEFKPYLTNVYVKEFDNTSLYKYKNKEVLAESNQSTIVGKFLIGKYDIKANKTIKDSLHNGKATGKLHIDLTGNRNGNKVYATEDFNQSWIKVTIKNNELLENNKYNIYIDDKEKEYKRQQVYGKYFNPTESKVYVTGKLEGKEFKTNENTIRRNYSNSSQNLTLSFDKGRISKYKEDSEQIKNKAKKFIENYSKYLNKAYKKSNYDEVSEYIEPNTKISKHIKKLIKNKTKVHYSKPKIKKIVRDNNDFYITVEKTTKGQNSETKYNLKYDTTFKDFKIVDVNYIN